MVDTSVPRGMTQSASEIGIMNVMTQSVFEIGIMNVMTQSAFKIGIMNVIDEIVSLMKTVVIGHRLEGNQTSVKT